MDDTTGRPTHARRLPDKIQLAFDHACDQGELEIAGRLLACCEMAIRNAPLPLRERRRAAETLCAGHERLWLLRRQQVGPR